MTIALFGAVGLFILAIMYEHGMIPFHFGRRVFFFYVIYVGLISVIYEWITT